MYMQGENRVSTGNYIHICIWVVHTGMETTMETTIRALVHFALLYNL